MEKGKQSRKQANFAVPALAGAGGLFAGWKLLGNNKDAESNPYLFWSMLGIFVIVLVGVGFFAYKKLK